jgi:hypothetical protein
MHDALACEDRGVSTVFLRTEPFMYAARDHAEAYGKPDYRAVPVRYPLASLTPKQAWARADEGLGGVIAILTGQARRVVALGQAPHEPSRHARVDYARAKASNRGGFLPDRPKNLFNC